jgi:hypothetical protein
MQQTISEDAFSIHANCWEMVVTGAESNHYDRYGLYVSRTIAVRHPELYLQADRLFITAATTYRGFKRAYQTKDVHDRYLFGPKKGGPPLTGPPFSFENVDFPKYRIIDFREYYPEGYPVFPFLDRRILPVASTLKSAENQITQLELGIQYYFSSNESERYLIYCDNENTYLYGGESLVWMKSGGPVETIQGNPILIFNEHHVWFPLMDRDDTAKDQTLRDLVQMYITEITIPPLEESEINLLEGLKRVTSLQSDYERDMVLLYSLRPCWGFNTYVQSDAYNTVRRHHPDLNDFTLEITSRMFMRHANHVSPVTSYLAAVMNYYRGKDMLERLEIEYVRHAATPSLSYAHGHTWFCDYVEQTVDECYTTRAGHCIVQACNIAAVLDIVDIEYYWLEGFSDEITFIHDWLYLPHFDTIISNGIITPYRDGTILFHVREYPLDQIDFIAQNDSWAFFRDLKLSGTIPPQDLMELLTELEGLHHDDIYILRQSGVGVSLDYFLQRLEIQQKASNLLRTGIIKKEEGELYDALQELFEAYSAFKTSGFTYSDNIQEESGMTFLDLEKDLVLLCLQVIKNADEAFQEERYEDALYGFALVHPSWQSLHTFLPLVMDSQEFEEYMEIGYVYTPLKIEETVRICIKEIENTAHMLFEENYKEESEEKINYIIRTLTETEWKYQEDIEDLQPEKEDTFMFPEERNLDVMCPVLIFFLLILCIGFIRYKKYMKHEKK